MILRHPRTATSANRSCAGTDYAELRFHWDGRPLAARQRHAIRPSHARTFDRESASAGSRFREELRLAHAVLLIPQTQIPFPTLRTGLRRQDGAGDTGRDGRVDHNVGSGSSNRAEGMLANTMASCAPQRLLGAPAVARLTVPLSGSYNRDGRRASAARTSLAGPHSRGPSSTRSAPWSYLPALAPPSAATSSRRNAAIDGVTHCRCSRQQKRPNATASSARALRRSRGCARPVHDWNCTRLPTEPGAGTGTPTMRVPSVVDPREESDVRSQPGAKSVMARSSRFQPRQRAIPSATQRAYPYLPPTQSREPVSMLRHEAVCPDSVMRGAARVE